MQIAQLKSYLDSPFKELQQLYEAELAYVTGYKVNSAGLYDQEFLRSTWSKSGVDIYIVLKENIAIGFAVVNLSSMLGQKDTRDIAEFFILPNYRKQKLGTEFAHTILAKYPGNWQIRQISKLVSARKFWLSTILSMKNIQDFKEEVNPNGWEGFVQNFRVKFQERLA